MFAALLLFFPGATGTYAQESPKVFVVLSRSIAPYQQAIEGFKKECDCQVELFDLQKSGIADQVQKRISDDKPALVLVVGSPALKLAKEKIKNTPVLFVMVLKPGKLPGNIAGVTMMLPAKVHLAGLKKMAEKVSTVGIVYNPKRSENRAAEFKQAADDLNLKLVSLTTESKKDAFSQIKLLEGRVDALFMIMDQDVVSNFNLLLSLSLKEKIPLATFSYKYVEMGALLSLAPKYDDMGAQAGGMAKTILTGSTAAKVGVISPRSHFYSINKKTAGKIGLVIPPAIEQLGPKYYQ